MRERLARITHTKIAKTIRFAVEGGVGAIPVVGMAAGRALSFSDSFVIEKLIGRPGPVSFLSAQYPSMFLPVDVSLEELLGHLSHDIAVMRNKKQTGSPAVSADPRPAGAITQKRLGRSSHR
jgi:hypothetical protein